MAKKSFEPLYTRWINLADALRKAKDNVDFGDIDPKLTADEQRTDNEVAVMVDEVVADMRSVATEMTGFFGIYVDGEIKDGIAKALGDEDTFQKMVALMIEQGILDPGSAAAMVAPAKKEKEVKAEDAKPEVKDEPKADAHKPHDGQNGSSNNHY